MMSSMHTTSMRTNRAGVSPKAPPIRRTCKTCASCRIKKVKCCGGHPKCAECITDELECVYPKDARREPRPSRARVRSLEATVSAMLERMKAAGVAPVDTSSEGWISGTVAEAEEASSPQRRGEHQLEPPARHNGPANSGHGINDTTTRPTATALPQQGILVLGSPPSSSRLDAAEGPPLNACPTAHANPTYTPGVGGSNDNGCQYLTPGSTCTALLPALSTQPPAAPLEPNTSPHAREEEKDRLSSLSPGEAHVAGVAHEHGCVSSVHGLASVMSNSSGKYNGASATNGMAQEEQARASVSKARLISYAALQSQREAWVYNQPQTTIDLDGCDVDLAKHLIELHFNMQHYTYLISYRPAIMESLATGGPWVNRLLLNAIYYSSSLFSNRSCLQRDPGDPQSIGARFHDRFFQLLGGEVARPSIPSATGLLLMSASLVSHGRPSAGWNLSGLAYRMVIDLGCHLTPGPDCQAQAAAHPNAKSVLNQDIEQEMRKRLYWGAFSTDVTQSLYLGRPCMLAPVEARVPLYFLDTFEEMEKWEPHLDPQTPEHCPPPYAPQPAYAVSTFGMLAKLLQLGARISKMYGIGATKGHAQDMLKELVGIEHELQEWDHSLPGHLRFDPEGSCIPPPNQITPHTTFHALNILLHRAFLEDGHLCHHADSGVTARSEEACLHSALMIEKLLRSFRDTFTLRGGPFLLCYATYSAVIVVLGHERRNRGQFMKQISFFWTCLSEMQKGCNFGMMKSLNILKEMVRQYDISIKLSSTATVGSGGGSAGEAAGQGGLDESFFEFPLPANSSLDDATAIISDDAWILNRPGDGDSHLPTVPHDQHLFGTAPSDPSMCLDGREQHVWQDTLYGLFTSSLPFD